MPRKGKKASPANSSVDVGVETPMPSVPGRRGRNESQQADPPAPIDSPAKHTRSQDQQESGSPEKEVFFLKINMPLFS